MRRSFTLVTFLALIVMVVLGAQLWHLYHSDVLEIIPPKFDFRAAREIYPFSVVPGGVYDWKDLTDSISHDPVARKHYEGIDTERVWAERVRKPMAAYVSYRKGDKVYWTDHPVNISEGEILLTDGKNLVRSRCGNRIEVKKPTLLPGAVPPPEPPPPDIVFDVPVPSLLPPTMVQPPVPPSIVGHNTPDPKYWRPPVWCCGPPSSPPATVPEPGTLVLVGAGVLGLVRFIRRS
jgi:hypothetical protein